MLSWMLWTYEQNVSSNANVCLELNWMVIMPNMAHSHNAEVMSVQINNPVPCLVHGLV